MVEAPRGRRILIGVLALFLILLPLYLWPLQIGSSLPGLAGLLGTAGDPRDPAAVARIPVEAWDVLMGGADAPPSQPLAPLPAPNLTMIADLPELTGSALDAGPGGGLLAEDSGLVQGLSGGSGGTGGEGAGAGGDAVGSAPSSLLASYPGGGSGDGNWSQFGGGYRDLSPWPGGGNPPRITSVPSFGGRGDPPVPTPEPATLVLVGSNVALLGAAAWRRRRRRRGSPAIG